MPSSQSNDRSRDEEELSDASVSARRHPSPRGFRILRLGQDDIEWQLLEDTDSSGAEDDPEDVISKHDLVTAPLMTREAYLSIRGDKRAAQYGVLGRVLAVQWVITS